MAGQVTKGTEVEKVTLHSYCQSSCGWRVRLALGLKGIPYEYKAVNITTGEQYSEEFTKLSPINLVPVLEIDEATIADSMAILMYLEEKFPDKRPLLPKDLVQRAAIRQVAYLITANIQPLQNISVLDQIEEKLGKEERMKWAQNCINKGFKGLEKILKKSAGKYAFGDELTLADVVLIPQVANAKRYGVDMEPYPTLGRLMKSLFELEEVQRSLPANQPDFPKKS